MTSVSAGHIILTPTQPVGSGRPQRKSNPEPPNQELSALPTELPRPPQDAENNQASNVKAQTNPKLTRSLMHFFLQYYYAQLFESKKSTLCKELFKKSCKKDGITSFTKNTTSSYYNAARAKNMHNKGYFTRDPTIQQKQPSCKTGDEIFGGP